MRALDRRSGDRNEGESRVAPFHENHFRTFHDRRFRSLEDERLRHLKDASGPKKTERITDNNNDPAIDERKFAKRATTNKAHERKERPFD